MTDYSYHDLRSMTVAQLREICTGIDHPAIEGVTQMRKADVILKMCEALGIETHEHHDVVGLDKAAVKAKIAEWRVQRAAALESGNHAQLKFARTKIRRLKRKIRRATV